MQTGDVRRFMEGAVDKLTPAKARELAKGLLEGGASREQLQKLQQELLDWSTRNRDRIVAVVQTEVTRQLKNAGFATRAEVEAVRKRVRALERAAGIGAAGKKTTKRAPRADRTSTGSGTGSSGTRPTGGEAGGGH
jgi:polyhydroxyalkanoate synthesis regulator phasin